MFDIKLDRVSKKYRVPLGAPANGHSWRGVSILSRRVQEVCALNDVSFEVKAGECFGIIGHNGSGKSTILKLLAGITAPSAGEISIRGRLSALLEVSSGFHPELTGRENIFLNGSMLGMSRSEISRKVGAIVDFAGLQNFVDIPVKRYSSGMYVRLGFSIAAHLEPDILLLDEVLAVGDLAFQAKCLARIAQFHQSQRTVLLISHDLEAIHRLCDRVLLMQGGQVAQIGQPAEVIDHYQQMSLSSAPADPVEASQPAKLAHCSGISFHAADSCGSVRTGYPVLARVEVQAARAIANVSISVQIYWPSGYLCAQLTTASSHPGMTLEQGASVIEFYCPSLEVQPGLYPVDLVVESDGLDLDRRTRCAMLNVHPGKAAFGDFFIDHTVTLSRGPKP